MDLSYVKIRKRTKRISLQRFLVTKLVQEMGKVTNYDILALYENQLWLERKCLTDFDFSRKFSKALGGLSKIMKEVNLSKDFSRQSLRLMRAKIQENLEGFLVPPRNFASFKERFANSFEVRPAFQPGRPKSSFPPKRFIGKGYGDKGSLRNLALDGSPAWQELSSAATYNDLLKEKGMEGVRDSVRRAKDLGDLAIIFTNLFYSGLEGPAPSNWNGDPLTPPNNPEALKRFLADIEDEGGKTSQLRKEIRRKY